MSSPNTEIRLQTFYHICRTARNAGATFGPPRGKAFISYSHRNRRICREGAGARPRKPLSRRAAIGGLRAGDGTDSCKHGRRPPPALAMLRIAAASSGHGNGLRPTLNNTEKPHGQLEIKTLPLPSTPFPLDFRVPRKAGFRVRRDLETRRVGAETPFPCASLLAGTEGDSTPIAARRFQTSPVSVVGAVALSPATRATHRARSRARSSSAS